MSTSPEVIALPIGINSQEILEEVAKDHMISQAERYIRERNLFKGTPTVKEFHMTLDFRIHDGMKFINYHLRMVMNNRGETVKDVVFEMDISREELALIYIKGLEKKIGVISYQSHTHDWR